MRRAVLLLVACGSADKPFPNRDPFTRDTDLEPVSVACHEDPAPGEPDRQTCAPRPYVSPFVWDHLDNVLFARIARGLSLETSGEARNVNSLDEVPDSAWFTNRTDAAPLGACTPADILPDPDEVDDGAWKIDHGKDNGSTPGFRIAIGGNRRYMLKADQPTRPERASAASTIGAAIYHAAGFNTSCEQVVVIEKRELRLQPGLTVVENSGVTHPFDDAALAKVLAGSTQLPGNRVRMEASKWLPGLSLGPFRYVGTRDDDPNDVIAHEDRRELRGSRLLAAWLDHWDAREQNSMDVWLATDGRHPRSSPGVVRHFILDTSDAMGEEVGGDAMARRSGFSYSFDPGDILIDVVTLGAVEHPWDRARIDPRHQKFAYFAARDFDPEAWKPQYPNPAFLRMTERDGAWMARIIARFSPADVRRFVDAGELSDPADADYLTQLLLARQHAILARYLSRLSPLGDVHVDGERLCATDFARLRGVFPTFRYQVVQDGVGGLAADAGADGRVCFTPKTRPGRATFTVDNGASRWPLRVFTYDGKVIGLSR